MPAPHQRAGQPCRAWRLVLSVGDCSAARGLYRGSMHGMPAACDRPAAFVHATASVRGRRCMSTHVPPGWVFADSRHSARMRVCECLWLDGASATQSCVRCANWMDEDTAREHCIVIAALLIGW